LVNPLQESEAEEDLQNALLIVLFAEGLVKTPALVYLKRCAGSVREKERLLRI